MAKFIKSIFSTSDRRKSNYEEGEEDKDIPPHTVSRKLSISRSGRMKQANKHRHCLSVELYGQNLKTAEKPNDVEYINTQSNQTSFTESKKTDNTQRQPSDRPTPEEEIDIAFKIIDKT